MANRTPQTQQKRQRERALQIKRQQKLARKLERSVAKREAKRDGEFESAPLAEMSRDPQNPGEVVIQSPEKSGKGP